jgi:hypothetical protein
MSTTSPNLGFILADGTDTFDNDRYIKGNFQIIDDNVLKKTKAVAGDGQQMETIEVSFVSDGTSYTLTKNNTPFVKTYANPPTVLPGNITQSISYSDTMSYPFISNTTSGSFSVVLKTSNTSNNFGSGTLKMKFLVFGS